MKFVDCHTKIKQVDAHSTIGNGVVVQVTGELSNAGNPLRRFMQTFVLAPQVININKRNNNSLKIKFRTVLKQGLQQTKLY